MGLLNTLQENFLKVGLYGARLQRREEGEAGGGPGPGEGIMWKCIPLIRPTDIRPTTILLTWPILW